MGRAAFLRDNGIDPSALEPTVEGLRRQGATVLFAGVDGRLGGIIVVGDPIRASTRAALDALHKEDIRIVMATGDSRSR